MTKSFVSLEQKVCLVCGQPYDTNALLLDKRMRDSLEKHTTTGYGLCPEHEKLHKDGFVAFVACDEAKSRKQPDGTVKFEDAYRTGDVAHVRLEVARRIFNLPISDQQPMVFCGMDVIERLQAMMPKEDGHASNC